MTRRFFLLLPAAIVPAPALAQRDGGADMDGPRARGGELVLLVVIGVVAWLYFRRR